MKGSKKKPTHTHTVGGGSGGAPSFRVRTGMPKEEASAAEGGTLGARFFKTVCGARERENLRARNVGIGGSKGPPWERTGEHLEVKNRGG